MTKKIKIAYLIDSIVSDMGGTEKQLLNIIRRLDHNQFDVSLICLYESSWMKENKLPCEVICLGYRGFLKPGFPLVLRRFIRLLKERRFEIVQTFFEDSMFVGYLGKLLSRTNHALITSRRDLGLGVDEPGYHQLYKKVKPFVLRSVNGIAANAHAIEEHIVKYENVPRDRITVIGNGIDVPSPCSSLPILFREYHADAWVGIVANLKPVKRIDLLLRALGYLKDSGSKSVVRAVVLGEGRLRSDLKKLAVDLGIGDRVHFEGAVENVSDYLFGLDIGILCSDREGLSNAILEYMACGLPVVVTDAGGNRELVDGTNGVRVPPGDHLALAHALEALIQSPRLRDDMGDRSLEKVRRFFAWDKIIPQWEGYYGRLAGNPAFGSDSVGERPC